MYLLNGWCIHVDINFQQPFYLLLFFPALLLIIWWWRTQKRVRGLRRYFIVLFRLMVFISLILSLARIELLFPIQGEKIVFVVDQSASMNNDPRSLDFINEAIANKEPEDSFAVISVGANAIIEQPLTTRDQLTAFGTVINPHATNLADGIRLAQGMIPSKSNGKIILITDGLENLGEMDKEIKLAQHRNIEVDGYYIQQEVGSEVLIDSVIVPNLLHLNEQFTSNVRIESTISTTGTLRFYAGNLQIAEKDVVIEKGENNFIFQQEAKQEGFQKFRVELLSNDDNLTVNNQASAFTQVKSTPKVLIVEGHQGAAANLVNALKTGGLEVEIRDVRLLPKELEDYKQYSTIILADTQAVDFEDIDMERIRTSVRDLGIGLLMTGGNDSFGLGGWFKTPIEEALPVYMDIRGKKQLPTLGLVLVIDKSGSMSGGLEGLDKMALAREAALRATDMLNEKDQIGVVAFDNQPWLVVEPQSAANLADIQKKISGIYADGGTDIFPALSMAYRQLEELDVQRKHIILLTDGQSGQNDNYQGLLAEMAEKNITVSTVAIGNDSDTFLLEQIANLGKGRYYFSNDPSSIPKIFSKETALASRTFIVNKPQIPFRGTIGEFSVLNTVVPVINSYIATSPKKTAEINLFSLDNDPILASWQYGLGRSVAWTSDLEGKWSADWVNWEQFGSFWNQIISWTYPQVNQGGWNVEINVSGMEASITVEVPSGKLPQQIEAIVINEQMESETVTLKPIAPKKLQGKFIAANQGTYMIQIVQVEGEMVVASQTEGLSIAYSPEYRINTNGEERIREAVALGGGKLINKPQEVFTNKVIGGYEHQDISNIFLMLAAIFWPIDIAARRLNLPSSLFEKLRKRSNTEKDNADLIKKSENLGSLIEKKKQKKRIPQIEQSKPLIKDRTQEEEGLAIIKKDKAKENNARTIENNQTQSVDTFSRLINAKNKKKN